MDVCMICGKAVFNLAAHFKEHAGENYLDYKTWSNAKKMQLLLNPILKFSEIESAVKEGNVDSIVDMFVKRGITV